jgi:hypothetical protein
MQTRQQAVATAREVLQQRGAAATRSLRDALHLPTNLSDTTLLGTAVAEAAAAESRRNPQFAAEVHRRYEELIGLKGGAAKRAAKGAEPLEPLVALRHTGKTVDPYAPPDPTELMYVYGNNKLWRALQDYTLDMLKQTSAKIEAAHPGTKPRNKSVKQSVIDYIVQYAGTSD